MTAKCDALEPHICRWPALLRAQRRSGKSAPMSITHIGVDADDTLWHNEPVFRLTHKRFNELLADFADEDALEARLAAVERSNITAYGYGAKGFTLSMLQ